MHFGNSAGNFGGSAVRRPVGHDSAAAMSKLVALLPNYMQIIQNWSEKGVYCTFLLKANMFLARALNNSKLPLDDGDVDLQATTLRRRRSLRSRTQS